MNIPDEVLSVIKCCLSQNIEHFVKDPYILSCGGNCCKKCIEDSKKRHSKCNFCHETHSKEEFKYLSANPSVEIMINTFSKDIIHYIKKEFEKTYSSAQVTNFYESIDDKLNLIEDKINKKIEALRNKLDEIQNDFKLEIKRAKAALKSFHPNEKIESIRQAYDGSNNLYDIQEKLHDLKLLINSRLEEKKSVQFIDNDINLTKASIGHINYPSYLKFGIIKSISTFKVDSRSLYRCAKYKNKLIVSDFDGKKIRYFSKQDQFKESFQLPNSLQGISPLAICTNKNDETYISDCSRNEIYKLNKELKLTNTYKNNSFATLNFLIYDDQTDFIYFTDWINNLLNIFDTESNIIIKSLRIDSPLHIRVSDEKLYLISGTELRSIKEKKDLNKATRGCIIELDKHNLEIKNKITFDDWILPIGLFIDSNKYLYTTAFNLDSSFDKMSESFLYIINPKGLCVHKVPLGGFEILNDFLIIEKSLYVIYHKEMKCIDFE